MQDAANHLWVCSRGRPGFCDAVKYYRTENAARNHASIDAKRNELECER